MIKISAVYKIVNTITGDVYIGSSKNVKVRWNAHRKPLVWRRHPNSKLYQDMQKYGVDKFRFQILCPLEPEHLKEVEQELIDIIKPTYNKNRAKGWNIERYKESLRKWRQSDKGKECKTLYRINNKEKIKEYNRAYRRTDKGREVNRAQSKKCVKKYSSQLCDYKGEVLTLGALAARFRRQLIKNPTKEAKKYLLKK